MRWLSGDQNGSAAPSVLRSAAPSAIRAIGSRVRFPLATRTDDERDHRAVGRDGDAQGVRVELSRPVAGGSTSACDAGASWRRSRGHMTAAAAAVIDDAGDCGAEPRQQRRRAVRRAAAAARRCSRVRARRARAARRRSRSTVASGSFSRQRRSSRESGGGRSHGQRLHLGSSFSTFASVIETSSPSNARRPVSISYSTTPNAQMSARRSTGLAARLLRRHVGGRAEDHAHLRRVSRERRGVHQVGRARRRPDPSALARPKSSTFTVPSARL